MFILYVEVNSAFLHLGLVMERVIGVQSLVVIFHIILRSVRLVRMSGVGRYSSVPGVDGVYIWYVIFLGPSYGDLHTLHPLFSILSIRPPWTCNFGHLWITESLGDIPHAFAHCFDTLDFADWQSFFLLEIRYQHWIRREGYQCKLVLTIMFSSYKWPHKMHISKVKKYLNCMSCGQHIINEMTQNRHSSFQGFRELL